jgi:hypothetical protein
MRSLHKTVIAPIAIALAVVMTPALAGCGIIPNPIESIVEGATGGDVDLGGAGLPDGFPEADVPLYDGEIVFGAAFGTGTEQVFNVTVSVPDAGAVDQIAADLEAAGFTSAGEVNLTSDQGGTLIYTSDTWGVLVVVATDGETGWSANYTVTSAATE